MKFRTTTIWIGLVSTGMLCLAVGAVQIPRKTKTNRPQIPPASSAGKAQQTATVNVIPMQVPQPTHQPANTAFRQSERGRSERGRPFTEAPPHHQMARQQPSRQATTPTFSRHSNTNQRANSGVVASSNHAFVQASGSVSEHRQKTAGYQEPEEWPFHRSATQGFAHAAQRQPVQAPAGAQPTRSVERSGITNWPYQPSNNRPVGSQSSVSTFGSSRANTDALSTNQFPGPQSNSTGSASHRQQPTNDLLNPALAFGGQSGSRPAPPLQHQMNAHPQAAFDRAQPQTSVASNQPVATPKHSPLSQLTDPFASIPQFPTPQALPAPALTTNVQPPAPSPRHQSVPQPTPGQPQNVLKTGHAGTENQIIHAYAESVTPRNYVTVGQSTEPRNRPVRSIQQVSFDACPDCEDVSRIPAESLINPYAARANGYPVNSALPHEAGQLAELPRNYAPWWEEVINKPLRVAPATRPVNVESLILEAIEHSPQVTAFRIDPIIRETQILEEAAEFDWQSFIETRYDDSNDPIGNTLTTGDNSDRFTDRNFSSRLGLEKRMAQGGTLDVSQKFGLQNNNSTFLFPPDQGTSRLELNFTQPLLRGAGQTYNESRTVLAMLDHQISEDDLQDSLQDHLLEVYTTYWNLYRARAIRLQKERLLRRAVEVEQKLTARQGIDSVRRQVLRARAAIASRRSEIARADMEVRNAESRLRLLVNSPGLKQSPIVELLPVEAPMSEYLSVSMRGSVETALQNRPDIRRAITQMKETAVRLEVSKNELLPKLDLVLGTYVAGLRGRSQVDTAWAEQFTEGRPGYTVGLMLQYPLGNRAAKARYAKREWEVAKTLKEFEASVEAGLSEVELSVREFETSYQEMLSRFQSMIAADTEANYLLERWRLLPGNDQTTSFLLEDLLDAQERVAMEEQDFVEAQVAYVLSVIQLKRASGILLNCDCGNSPVSFMTPAPRGAAQPQSMPKPVTQKPALPKPAPSNPKLPQPSLVLPGNQLPDSPQPPAKNVTPQPGTPSQDDPAIIPLPNPAPLPGPVRSQL